MILAIKEIVIKPKKISRLWTGFEPVTFTLPGGGGGEVFSIMAYTGRLHPKGEPFSGFRYIKG